MAFNEKHIQIIETAEHLFASKGYDGTSVRDIADEAGVNVSMISYYFGSKEKLMEALFEHRTGNIRSRVETLLQDAGLTPFQKFDMLIDEHIDRVMQKQQFFRVMTCEQVINKNPVILDLLSDIKKRNAVLINELIKDGQKKGAFKKKVDVVMLLNTMVGTVSQMMINLSYYRDFNNLQDMPDEEFQALIKKKLSTHIKNLFKAILTHE